MIQTGHDLQAYFDLRNACQKDRPTDIAAQDPVISGECNMQNAKLIQNDGHFRSLLNGYLKNKTSVDQVTKTKSFALHAQNSSMHARIN